MRIPSIIPILLVTLTIGLSQLRGDGFANRVVALLGYFTAGFVASLFAFEFYRGGFDPPPSYAESQVTEDINLWGMVQVTSVRFVIPYMTAFFFATAVYESMRLVCRLLTRRDEQVPVRSWHYDD